MASVFVALALIGSLDYFCEDCRPNYRDASAEIVAELVARL